MLILPQRTQNNAFNVFIWASLFVGLGMQMCLYSIEWYARQNCPRYVVSRACLLSSAAQSFRVSLLCRTVYWIISSLDHCSVEIEMMCPRPCRLMFQTFSFVVKLISDRHGVSTKFREVYSKQMYDRNFVRFSPPL